MGLTNYEINFVMKKTPDLASMCNFWSGVGTTAYLNKTNNSLTFPKNVPAIELGPGFNPLLIGEPTEYIGVEPIHKNETEKILKTKNLEPHFKKLRSENKLRVIQTDAYSFLKNLPNNSAFVYSFGLFDVCNQLGGNCETQEEINIKEKYVQALTDEIARVTPDKTVSIHKGICHADYFTKAGFVPLPVSNDTTFSIHFLKHKMNHGDSIENPLNKNQRIECKKLSSGINFWIFK
jgi:hypothetical protein